MNKLFTLLLGLSLGTLGFSQVVIESDLSSWTAGDPDGFMGSKTNIGSENVNEITMGSEHGTSLAQLINADGSHKRFTTEEVAVDELETYEIKIWINGFPGSELRTGYYDASNDSWFYNDYLDVAAEAGGSITMVSQTVTLPAGCAAAEFILSVRNTDESVGIVVDSMSVEVTTGVDPEEVSIYDIQYATEAPFASAYEGMVVTTSGIVTGVFTAGGDEGRFFIQDGSGAWNGVYVYENGTTVNIGDSVRVTGTVDEFFELTELVSVLEVAVISSDNDLPEAVAVATSDVSMEQYEGVLVMVEDAECTNDDAGFGQFEVNDGSGARLIDDEMFSYAAVAGNFYNVTGVSFLSFGDVKIYPRSVADITVTGYASVEENSAEFSLYPNPSSDWVKVNVPATANVTIYDLSGAVVFAQNGNVNTINVADFDTGVYLVSVVDNGSTHTERLIVK